MKKLWNMQVEYSYRKDRMEVKICLEYQVLESPRSIGAYIMDKKMSNPLRAC